MKIPGSPQLVALTEGSDIPLEKPIVLIGRHQECDIQIPSRKISRRHCCVALVDDHVVVRDLGSTNGIRINGVKVTEGNLQEDDELTIGNMRYQLRWSSDSSASLKHAIQSTAKQNVNADDSEEVPTPLRDAPASHPILPGEPKAATESSK